MYLRKLKLKDAELMLEWMHDEEVVKNLYTNFSSKTIDDCICFINYKSENNIHLAIADDADEYMGTVSLKNINYDEKNAEFAITIRRCAQGKGVSAQAMKEILAIGFNKYKLENIYWCVNKNNLRAVRFYDKNNYRRCNDVPLNIYNNYDEKVQYSLIWYFCSNTEV